MSLYFSLIAFVALFNLLGENLEIVLVNHIRQGSVVKPAEGPPEVDHGWVLGEHPEIGVEDGCGAVGHGHFARSRNWGVNRHSNLPMRSDCEPLNLRR